MTRRSRRLPSEWRMSEGLAATFSARSGARRTRARQQELLQPSTRTHKHTHTASLGRAPSRTRVRAQPSYGLPHPWSRERSPRSASLRLRGTREGGSAASAPSLRHR